MVGREKHTTVHGPDYIRVNTLRYLERKNVCIGTKIHQKALFHSSIQAIAYDNKNESEKLLLTGLLKIKPQ